MSKSRALCCKTLKYDKVERTFFDSVLLWTKKMAYLHYHQTRHFIHYDFDIYCVFWTCSEVFQLPHIGEGWVRMRSTLINSQLESCESCLLSISQMGITVDFQKQIFPFTSWGSSQYQESKPGKKTHLDLSIWTWVTWENESMPQLVRRAPEVDGAGGEEVLRETKQIDKHSQAGLCNKRKGKELTSPF